MNLTPYICTQCGGKIDVSRMQCEYCGTQYKNDDLRKVKFEVVRPGVNRIVAQVSVPHEVLRDPEMARDYTLTELRNQLADGILAYMKIDARNDPCTLSQIIRGEVRVVDPGFDY